MVQKSNLQILLARQGGISHASKNLMKFSEIISLVKLSDNDIIMVPKQPHVLPLQLLLIKFISPKNAPKFFFV